MGSTRALEWNPTVWVESGRQYLSDVQTEFRKVTWPSQREYVGGTIGVVVIVAIGAISQIFKTRLKATVEKSEASFKNLAQRVARLEDRIGNLETIVVEKERIQKFSEM